MRICVFGAGSLGSAVGGLLSQNHDVTLVGRREHVQAIRRNGLKLHGDVTLTAKVKAEVNASNIEVPDLLIICTKAYDTSCAIDGCRRIVGEETAVLTLQNGLGNLEQLREWRGDLAFGGTTTMGAALESPGIVRVSGRGRTSVGADNNPAGARSIVDALKLCGIRAEVKKDSLREIWGKAVVNACINPVAAVLRVNNGRLLESRTITRFMQDVCRECEAVASASNVALPSSNMFSRVRAVCTDTRHNVSSMFQDVMKGRQTEIRQINGAFCERGETLNVQTPLNRTLVAMIEPLQQFQKGERLIS